MNIENLIDREKGWYAIEMEIKGGYISTPNNEYPGSKETEQTTKRIENKMKELEKKHNHKFAKPLRTHTESSNIREYTVKTDNIKLKSDLYLAVGKYTKNNTHSPIGANGYISWWTHLHVFLTKEWLRYVKKNFQNIYANLLALPFYSKVNYIKKRVKFFHRERRWTFNTLLDVLNGEILYGKCRWMAINRDFDSIEFRANNVIHPFQFLYFLYIIMITKTHTKLVEFDASRLLIEGSEKIIPTEGPKNISILRHSIGNNYCIKHRIMDIINIMPDSIKRNKYRLDITKDYARTIGMNTKNWQKEQYKELIQQLNSLYPKVTNDKDKQSVTRTGTVQSRYQLSSDEFDELSTGSRPQEDTCVQGTS